MTINPAGQLSPTLVQDLADFLEELECQFWACDGRPTTDPVAMKTCSRCIILGRLLDEAQLGRPA